MEQLEQVREASDRIIHVIDQEKQAGATPMILCIALIDAAVRMGRFCAPTATTPSLLRDFAEIVLEMARDEEATDTNQEILQ